MYYEDMLIKGIFYWRGTPTGKWHKMNIKQLTKKLIELKEVIT